MSLKWRALKTRSKIMLGLGVIGLVTLLALITLTAQHTLGRYYFEQACDTEGAWFRYESDRVKAEEPGDARPDYKSRAYDYQGAMGCSGSDPDPCPRDLFDITFPHDFIEIFVYEPHAEFLSSETGWYRYWLAPLHDTACAAFYSSEKAQENWRELISKPSRRPDPPPNIDRMEDKCIASEKIEKPTSHYFSRSHHVSNQGFLNTWTTSHRNLTDLRTGEIVWYQRYDTEYPGSWFDRVDAWLHDREFNARHCSYLKDYAHNSLPMPEEPVYAEEPIYGL